MRSTSCITRLVFTHTHTQSGHYSMGGETEAQGGGCSLQGRWYLRGGDKCRFLLCVAPDTRRAWGGSQVQEYPRPTLLGLTWPPDQGLACVILRDPGPWGGGPEGIRGGASPALGARVTGPQMPEPPVRHGAGSGSLLSPAALHRKQLFTWVRCSAGAYSDGFLSSRFPLRCPRPPGKLGAGVGGVGGVGGQRAAHCQSCLWERELLSCCVHTVDPSNHPGLGRADAHPSPGAQRPPLGLALRHPRPELMGLKGTCQEATDGVSRVRSLCYSWQSGMDALARKAGVPALLGGSCDPSGSPGLLILSPGPGGQIHM